MKKFLPIVLLFLATLSGCNSEGDPYLSQNEELRIDIRSLVVHSDYQLLADPTRRWGVPFEMYDAEFKEGGNVVEISVRFSGGCGTHRFGIYAEDTYEGVANFDAPIDVTLYLYHSQVDEECSSPQDMVLRQGDLSFLAPGRYNLTLESTSDRTAFRVSDYEIN